MLAPFLSALDMERSKFPFIIIVTVNIEHVKANMVLLVNHH
jgi:hypothetical protein